MSSTTSMSKVPILLLKTKSTPADSYEELLSQPQDGTVFTPQFVPVLQHKFEEAGMNTVRKLLRGEEIGSTNTSQFGGMIFTSQRAVEAFAKVAKEISKDHPSWPHLQQVPIYSVGPATTRALSAVAQDPPLQIFGSHTGNGDALAHFILEHYGDWYRDRPIKPPLLFLVGEQRRDIIPKTLMDSLLPADQMIQVTEEVVYGTREMESFPRDFKQVLTETQRSTCRWVIVFSPTGCDSMLRGLGMLDEDTGKFRPSARDGQTFIATIGPTTRAHLVNCFDFEPDVCAEKPSPRGVLEGILGFEKNHRPS